MVCHVQCVPQITCSEYRDSNPSKVVSKPERATLGSSSTTRIERPLSARLCMTIPRAGDESALVHFGFGKINTGHQCPSRSRLQSAETRVIWRGTPGHREPQAQPDPAISTKRQRVRYLQTSPDRCGWSFAAMSWGSGTDCRADAKLEARRGSRARARLARSATTGRCLCSETISSS